MHQTILQRCRRISCACANSVYQALSLLSCERPWDKTTCTYGTDQTKVIYMYVYDKQMVRHIRYEGIVRLVLYICMYICNFRCVHIHVRKVQSKAKWYMTSGHFPRGKMICLEQDSDIQF